MLSRRSSSIRRFSGRLVRCRSNHARSASSLRQSWAISEEVADAVRSGKPVVALETAIYTHGFPYPENVALSSSLESLVRANGGIPATIGILNGTAKVGMQPEEIVELLEKTGKPNVVKVSRRDLAILCSSSEYSGGTTIAGGLVMAHLSGIKVFATGGLGGVHRDKPGETSMDVSADLMELGRTPVALITSGCKSFLDISRTLEVLETQGVGVSTFADGRTGPVDWPAFWTRESGIASPNTVRDEKHAASIIHAQLGFPLTSGLLFANPIPAEFSISNADIDDITALAVEEAGAKGVTGSDNTPYILKRIKELSSGATVAANKALVEANVIRGTKVAVELAKLENASRLKHSFGVPQVKPSLNGDKDVDVIIAGSVAIDLSCDYSPIVRADKRISMHTSNPARVHESLGGVACNVARACHLVGSRSLLCSVVGDDPAAESVRGALHKLGMSTAGILDGFRESRTARYVAVNDSNKELVVAMADMSIVETNQVDFDSIWLPLLEQKRPKWVVVDANWSANTLHSWIRAARHVGAKVAFEPVSVEKSTRLLSNDREKHLENTGSGFVEPTANSLRHSCSAIVDLVTPNALEAVTMSEMLSQHDPWADFIESLPDSRFDQLIRTRTGRGDADDWIAIVKASLKLLSRSRCVLTKLGSKGVLHAEALSHTDPRMQSLGKRDDMVFCSDEVGRSLSMGPDKIIPTGGYQNPLNDIGAVLFKHHAGGFVPEEKIESVNGVGDTFLGVLVANLAQRNCVEMEEAISRAQKGAVLTLQSRESVSPSLTFLASTCSYDGKV